MIGSVANGSTFAAGGAALSARQVGLITLAAFGGAGAKLLDLMSEKAADGDDSDQGNHLYHGTDIGTARMLASGAPIMIDVQSCNWTASCGGFYLADNIGDAEHFAVFTQNGVRDGGAVQYNFTNLAYLTITSLSNIRPIPPAPRFQPLGNEIVVPQKAFPVFNGLMSQGKIVPEAVR